jgi:hypothetical protein
MARGQGVNPFGIPTNAQPMDEKGGSVTIPWRLFFTRLAQSVANLILSAVPGAPNTSVQYNKLGSFAGSSEFTFNDTTQQVAITADTASSQLVVQNATASTGVVAVNPRLANYEDITLGSKLNTSGDYIPNDTDNGIVFRQDGKVGVELEQGLTPGTPISFAAGLGVSVNGSSDSVPLAVEAYEYGGLGTGAVPGMSLYADRNSSGAGAASTLGLEELNGTPKYVWFDATGAPRYGPARPTESGSVSDTSGNLFASGVNLVQRSTLTLTDTQIKALPTTPVQLVATPGAGLWIKPMAVTYQTHIVGAYTNLNATYVDFHQTLDTYYVSYGPVDDSTTTPTLTNVTALLTTVADLVQEIGQPNLAAVGASATTQGYVQQVSQAGTGQLGNKPLMMNIDNNGSGNLTGGNASNTLKVKIYYVVEAI